MLVGGWKGRVTKQYCVKGGLGREAQVCLGGDQQADSPQFPHSGLQLLQPSLLICELSDVFGHFLQFTPQSPLQAHQQRPQLLLQLPCVAPTSGCDLQLYLSTHVIHKLMCVEGRGEREGGGRWKRGEKTIICWTLFQPQVHI